MSGVTNVAHDVWPPKSLRSSLDSPLLSAYPVFEVHSLLLSFLLVSSETFLCYNQPKKSVSNREKRLTDPPLLHCPSRERKNGKSLGHDLCE